MNITNNIAIENKHHIAGHSFGLLVSIIAKTGPNIIWNTLILQDPYIIGRINTEMRYAEEKIKPKFFKGKPHAKCKLPLVAQRLAPHNTSVPTLQDCAHENGYTLINIKIAAAKQIVNTYPEILSLTLVGIKCMNIMFIKNGWNAICK